MRKLRAGDFWRIDDRTGFRVPASETVKEWNGAIVHRRHSEPRHPQDLLRARPNRMRVPDARPPPVDQYIGPLMTEITEAASAGDRVIDVLHTDRFLPGDRIGLYLGSGDMYRAIVQIVESSTELRLTAPLPDAVAVGGVVVNFTAVSPPVLE